MHKRSFWCFLFLWMFFVTPAQAQTDPILQFIQEHPEKSAVYLIRNDSVVASLNEKKLMPLASTVKLILAIEFAKQAGAGVIDTARKVALKDLEKFHIRGTDGNAHPTWIQYEKSKGHITNDSVALIHVARGMIMFSSNANTEYLMDVLGIDQVNQNLSLLQLNPHTPVYPIVAALFLYQNPKEKNEEKVLKAISKLNPQEYARYCYQLHLQLKNSSTLKESFRPFDFSLPMQKMWSDRLPASTVQTYARLANILNHRKFFTPAAYGVLARITEFIMENPANAGFLKHAGMKGGSTGTVLTKCMYATLLDGTTIELAYFFNHLTFKEVNQLSTQMNAFELQLLSNPAFAEEVADVLKKQAL